MNKDKYKHIRIKGSTIIRAKSEEEYRQIINKLTKWPNDEEHAKNLENLKELLRKHKRARERMTKEEHLGTIVKLLKEVLYHLMYYNDLYGSFLDEYEQIEKIYKTLSSIYRYEVKSNDNQSS